MTPRWMRHIARLLKSWAVEKWESRPSWMGDESPAYVALTIAIALLTVIVFTDIFWRATHPYWG